VSSLYCPTDLNKPVEEEEKIFQSHLISVLAYCCAAPDSWGAFHKIADTETEPSAGETEIYATLKTALQSVIPLRVILDRIADFEGEPRWQAPFLRLLTSMYLSEAVLHREVKTSRDLEKRLLNIMKALPYEKDATLACFGALPAINM
jgi:hypothetical protein